MGQPRIIYIGKTVRRLDYSLGEALEQLKQHEKFAKSYEVLDTPEERDKLTLKMLEEAKDKIK